MGDDFGTVWQRIVRMQGATFNQIRGKEFTYRVAGGHVVPSTTNRNLPRSSFQAAFERGPLTNTVALRDLQGPSYLFAILTDPRISSNDGGNR